MVGDRSFGTFKLLLLVISLVVLGLLAVLAFRIGPPPAVKISSSLPAIGRRTTIRARVEEPVRGLSRVKLELVQGEQAQVLAEKSYPYRGALAFWGAFTPRDELNVEVGRDTFSGLRSGEATVRVTADRAVSWFRQPAPVVEQISLPVRLSPPSLQITSSQVYVAQGGCEVVVYSVGDSCIRDGVRVGDWWFPGYPLPGGGKQARFAFFGVPYDSDDSGVRLVAADDAGNEAEASFIEKFFPKPFKKDSIEVTDKFLAKVVPEILSQSPEIQDKKDLLENYLAINGELRRKNAATLKELGKQSRSEFLWKSSFLPLTNAKVMSAFADRRTYSFGGKEIDHQDHLGFDLAVTLRTPVPAANDGVVLLAKYFGIYGNTVVIDHGFGLMSLYGHLATMSVNPGQNVKRGETVGLTGQTGLAGGDHLHYTMLIQGLPVNPVEWWDSHWIRDRIARKLGPALPFSEE